MNNNINPFLLTDGYKLSHHKMYPDGTTLVYCNFTPRSNKLAPEGCDHIVNFGYQMIVQQIYEVFETNFFDVPKRQACGEVQKAFSTYLGVPYDVSHIEKLWDLGALPLVIKTLEEGTLSPMKVPVLTIYNTYPDFFWLPNFLETLISNLLWKPVTSATMAFQFKKLLTERALKTDQHNVEFVDFQAHDFSMRGIAGIDAVISSGLGHATSFTGSDSIPVLYGSKKYYGETGFVVGGIPATEHSVMCAGGKEDEVETFRRLLNIYPTGLLGVVSDTWDLWKVCTEHLVTLKEEILARDGKLVIRPDSGDPVDIICGLNTQSKHLLDPTCNNYEDCGIKYKEKYSKSEYKGVIELLWDIFGGTINDQGYKVLDSHIGCIYGDSITLERAEQICNRLEAKGFASTNVVFGIGSFTYQYNTRDTFGFAMKATYIEINGRSREIFKDPITDDGQKKSAKGLIHVSKDSDGEYTMIDGQSWESENHGELKTIFTDGVFYNTVTLTDIRKKLKEYANRN